jgi:tetratricopeptide (TPR) repeat protein
MVTLGNGALLGLFGIIQQLSSPSTLLYWTWESQGTVFGPFICRNHFSFYVNMCTGLGLGLLLSLPARTGRGQRGRLLQHPLAPWVALALGLCLSGTLFSLSRGGFLALLAAASACGLLAMRAASRSVFATVPGAAVLFGVSFAVGTALWFGYDRISTRLETIWGGDALAESRSGLWARSLELVPESAWLGAGYGSFQYVEPLKRVDGKEAQYYFENAHNEYLEALVEGGIIRLLLTLAIIGFVAHLGLRAVRRYAGTPSAFLVLGALFAVLTTVIHSVGEFGIHVPALALLATVICAMLCGLGDNGERASLQARGLAPFAAAAVLLALGLVLCGSGWSTYLTHHLRENAAVLKERTDLPSRLLAATSLDAAAKLNPEFAHLEVSRAQAHSRVYDETVKELQRHELSCEIGALILNYAGHAGTPALTLYVAMGSAWDSVLGTDLQRQVVAKVHLVPALQSYLRARNACPLLEEPHRALAQHHALLAQGDERGVYLRRAKLLSPGIPLVWYECGLIEVETEPKAARASWRRSLELGSPYLKPILEESKRRFTPAEILDMLPERPAYLLEAARTLYPDNDDIDLRKPFLERAVVALNQQPPERDQDYVLKAQLYRQLEQFNEAAAAYRAALNRMPREVGLRMEFAWYLYNQQKYQDARAEVLAVLNQQPRHGEAKALLEQIVVKGN